jgi:large subunit ribosomal protein L32
MPQEPKKKHSKARKRARRASINLKALGLQLCPECKLPTLAHTACKNCGFYAGKKVTDTARVKVTKA